MSFQREWIRRDRPTDTIDIPSEPYAYGPYINVKEGQNLDIDLARYISQGPVEVISKPYFLQKDGTHLKGQVPTGDTTSYKIVIEDRGGRQ